ncbi:MAG: TMEM175 family protein [Ginsengibacter sp.]
MEKLKEHKEKETARLEAFSDGIFSVAITLLALEIGIKEYEGATNGNLWQRILDNWPEYFTFFNSFATVLLIWMGHHKIFNRVWKTNRAIILLNGLLLLFVALFPFPTKTVGAFIGTGAVNTAVAFYAGFTGLIVVCMLFLNLSIIKNPNLLIKKETSLPWFKNQVKQQLIAIAVYGVAAIVAFYSAAIALGLTFLMWVFWAIVTKDTEDEKI